VGSAVHVAREQVAAAPFQHDLCVALVLEAAMNAPEHRARRPRRG